MCVCDIKNREVSLMNKLDELIKIRTKVIPYHTTADRTNNNKKSLSNIKTTKFRIFVYENKKLRKY